MIKEITSKEPPTHVVVLTALESEDAVEAVRLGARGIVLEDRPKMEKAIRRLLP